MNLLDIFGVHEIEVKNLKGHNAHGQPVYEEPETISGVYVADRSQMVRNERGDEVISTAQIALPLEHKITAKALITLPDGRLTSVISVARGDAVGLPLPRLQVINCE